MIARHSMVACGFNRVSFCVCSTGAVEEKEAED